jgi:hypothetical protein
MTGTQDLKTRVLITTAAFAVFAATPALACSVGRMSPRELRVEQTRDVRDADLVFLARVTGQGTSDDPNTNIIFFEPIRRVSGRAEPPPALAVAIFYCFTPPSVGETQVILMRTIDISATPDRTSPVLGYYAVSDIEHPRLRQRVAWALQRVDSQ